MSLQYGLYESFQGNKPSSSSSSSSASSSKQRRKTRATVESMNTIRDAKLKNGDLSKRVTDMLNNMGNVQETMEGDGLANFNPPPPPIIKDTDTTVTSGFASPFERPGVGNGKEHIYEPNSNMTKEGFMSGKGGEQFRAPSSDYTSSYNSQLSDAMKAFSGNARAPGVYTPSNGIYNGGGSGHGVPTMIGGSSDQVLEKLNHLIRLLEDQQHERTEHVTEEFLLYIFLGIFVIYVVDSFSRSGKYIR